MPECSMLEQLYWRCLDKIDCVCGLCSEGEAWRSKPSIPRRQVNDGAANTPTDVNAKAPDKSAILMKPAPSLLSGTFTETTGVSLKMKLQTRLGQTNPNQLRLDQTSPNQTRPQSIDKLLGKIS